jgi:chromosome segregation ATPase
LVIFRALGSKLAHLDLELESTRLEMENLKTTKTRAKEISAMTLQKISELEEKLADLNQEYKALTATIQTCQSKYLTIEDEVLIYLSYQIPCEMLDKLEH